MIRKHKGSNNFKISRDIIKKSRRIDDNVQIYSEILSTFAYKYLSDNLKKFLTELIKEENYSFNEAYQNKEYYDYLERNALDELGYFFTMPDMFIDNLIKDNYESSYLDRILRDAFKEGIKFNEYASTSKYFNLLFDEDYGEYYRKNSYHERNLIIRDFILLISKLDVFEEEFKYGQVFNVVANSRIVRARGTPEYIYDILVPLILKSKPKILNAYNPFLEDASSLVRLFNEGEITNVYGKESNKINFLTSVVNMIINGINCNHIFFFKDNALESVEIDDIYFDAVISKVPNQFRDISSEYNSKKVSYNSNYKKEMELKKQVLSNLNMEHADLNEKMQKSLNDFIGEITYDSCKVSEFSGEYESLADNEYRFIIDMISSLKEDGIMAISVSQNFLFKNSQQIMRKFLTFENNYLDAVIGLPEELGRSIRPEVILIFKKNKSDETVLFIDPSRKYSTKMSENRIPGVFRKFLLFDEESKNNVVDCYFERKTVDKFSNLVTIEEICKNDFNLSISRYVDTYEGEFIDLNNLAADKKEIDEKMSDLNKKINKLMDDLDIKL